MDKQKRKVILTVGIVIMVLGWIMGGLFIANSVLGFMDGIQDAVSQLGAGSWIAFSLLFIVVSTVLFFVGGIGSAFIYTANLLFPTVQAFIISAICIFISSMVVYFAGKKLGTKAIKWAVSEEAYEKANKVIGSPTFIALFLLFPGFPDNLVCFFAGSSKLRWWGFALTALLTRTVGVASICFMGDAMSIEVWKPMFDTIGIFPSIAFLFTLGMAMLAFIVSFFYLGKKLEKRFDTKHPKEDKEEAIR